MRTTLTKDDDGVVAHTLSPDHRDIVTSWRLVYYPPHARLETHHHEVAQFSVLLSGHARETTDKGAFDSRPMLMEFKPAGFRHSNEFGPDGALLLSININPDNLDFNEAYPTRDWLLRPAPDARRRWATLVSHISSGTVGSDVMESSTFDLLLLLIARESDTRASAPPAWLLRAHAAIVETENSLESIAADAGVHRVHLSRAFRSYFGRTISECRREARLSQAVRLLAHAGVSAGTTSYAAGFSDQSHLTRVMRGAFGLTPGVLRSIFHRQCYRHTRRLARRS